MDYRVIVVEDDQLPDGTDWALARVGSDAYLMLKRCRCSVEGGLCDLLEDVWRTRVTAADLPPVLSLVG